MFVSKAVLVCFCGLIELRHCIEYCVQLHFQSKTAYLFEIDSDKQSPQCANCVWWIVYVYVVTQLRLTSSGLHAQPKSTFFCCSTLERQIAGISLLLSYRMSACMLAGAGALHFTCYNRPFLVPLSKVPACRQIWIFLPSSTACCPDLAATLLLTEVTQPPLLVSNLQACPTPPPPPFMMAACWPGLANFKGTSTSPRSHPCLWAR